MGTKLPVDFPTLGFVYGFISPSDSLVKIGYTCDLERRKGEVRRNRGTELLEAFCVPTFCPRYDEQRIHRNLGHLRVKGEWFELEESAIIAAVSVQIPYVNLPLICQYLMAYLASLPDCGGPSAVSDAVWALEGLHPMVQHEIIDSSPSVREVSKAGWELRTRFQPSTLPEWHQGYSDVRKPALTIL